MGLRSIECLRIYFVGQPTWGGSPAFGSVRKFYSGVGNGRSFWKHDMRIDGSEGRWVQRTQVDGTGLRSCPVAGFGISGSDTT
jgi:hypothetical protein